MIDSSQNDGRPRFSIVAVTYNCLNYLQGLIASIQVYPPQGGFEIIVVDNASSDQTAQWCLDAPLDIRLIINQENRGFAAAANAGAKHARGEYILFCNPDVRWTSPVADLLAAAIEAFPGCGAAAGRMLFPDGSFQPTCRRFPTFANIWFSRGSLLSRFVQPRSEGLEYTLPDYEYPTWVDAAAATCLLLRRDVFVELEGFDERFFMYVEDTDLCRRLWEADLQTWFIPAATAIHYWGGSSTDQSAVSRYHLASIREYFRKHYPRAWLRNRLLSLLLYLRERTIPKKRAGA